ncbi:MAG: LPS export ABC transporter periplasmic protein LptC [Nitrospirae bacterium]|nr:LPS export ABC transporter periplasmic protein LptC [Nitrospirota bacterium]
MTKKVIFAIIIITAFSFFYLIGGEKGARLDAQLKGDSFFEGLKIINRKDGAADWILLAKRADMTSDGKQALLSGVEMKLERQGLTVSADRGVYDMETGQISVEGFLQASSRNFTLTTSKVLFDGRKGHLDTAGDVKIDGKKFELEGKGMQAENNDHKVRILKDVKATFNR